VRQETQATTRATRPPARARIVLVLLALGLVLVVLRAPVLLFALTDPFRHGSNGGTLQVPASVTDDAVGAVHFEPRAPQQGPTVEETDGASEGRWGASPVRPEASGLLLQEIRGGWRVEAGGEEAAALAVIAAHAWADARTTTSPGSSGGAVVTVEAVERPGALHAVVTVLVSDASGLSRLAFPFTFEADGPRLAGAPWSLPPPAVERSPLGGTSIADPVLIEAARRALETIGISADRLAAVEATDGWPFIARLDDETAGHPWLRWHLDRFVVSGLPLHRSEEYTRAPTLRGVGP